MCKSYLSGKKTTLESFDEYTYYEKFATSLRMGDIGYQNNKEDDMGVHIDYNSLEKYSKSLDEAIKKPSKEYEKIGVYSDGYYKQINANTLQIENEYYSTIRPKPDPNIKKRPSKALLESGVNYIELRSIDNNIFSNTGIDIDQMYFIELLMIHSLIINDSQISQEEYIESKNNLTNVAHNGRDKEFQLINNNQAKSIALALREILIELRKIAELMHKITNDDKYIRCIKKQEEKFENNYKLPSNLVIDKMIENKFSFYEFCMENIWEQKKHFSTLDFDNDIIKKLKKEALVSIEKKKLLEKNIAESYEDYIRRYFSEK